MGGNQGQELSRKAVRVQHTVILTSQGWLWFYRVIEMGVSKKVVSMKSFWPGDAVF